ncbi:hypothetical protein O6P43_031006 [Quillaja saponaria]|uniref:Uncharacterized protein n=1 Tax=Quillaja saponaria TaxID=32244 RepID=A0AAD7KUE5_QUISA|nr:hypothetical protein O6P43_031006 [Quillaja saponaria]
MLELVIWWTHGVVAEICAHHMNFENQPLKDQSYKLGAAADTSSPAFIASSTAGGGGGGGLILPSMQEEHLVSTQLSMSYCS